MIIRNPCLLIAQVLVLIRVHHQDGVSTIDCPSDVGKLGSLLESVVYNQAAGPLPGTHYTCARWRVWSALTDFMLGCPLSEVKYSREVNNVKINQDSSQYVLLYLTHEWSQGVSRRSPKSPSKWRRIHLFLHRRYVFRVHLVSQGTCKCSGR